VFAPVAVGDGKFSGSDSGLMAAAWVSGPSVLRNDLRAWSHLLTLTRRNPGVCGGRSLPVQRYVLPTGQQSWRGVSQRRQWSR